MILTWRKRHSRHLAHPNLARATVSMFPSTSSENHGKWRLLSPLWLIAPLFWLLPVPLLGILFSALALRRIKLHAPVMAWRKAALLGLMVFLLFSTAAPAHRLCYRPGIPTHATPLASPPRRCIADPTPYSELSVASKKNSGLPLATRQSFNLCFTPPRHAPRKVSGRKRDRDQLHQPHRNGQLARSG